MKIIPSILFFILFTQCSLQAQTPGEWTWMHGDSVPGQAPVFGVQGVPDPANKPGGVYEGTEWVDPNGNFYLYGGLDHNNQTQGDLWKYDPVVNEWTWLNGSGGAGGSPVWGIQGVASAANHPGERGYGMLSWVDDAGNLWMFGGYSNAAAAYRADLWKYDIGNNMWTWMSGDTVPGTTGNHGIMGIPSPNNRPPSTSETACAWRAGSELWFYGGMNLSQVIGDLWRYSIPTGEWTWMHGDSTFNAPPVYGTLGVSHPSNSPGGRRSYSHWQDLAGDFWMFGGTDGVAMKNDLWKYTLATNEWTWMNGPTITYDPGNFGSKCNPSSTNLPPSRLEARMAWTDPCGGFWVMGGYIPTAASNDLWRYDTGTGLWTWINGSTTAGAPSVYGIKGVSNPANVPGARMGAHPFMDNAGNLWLFGGMDGGAFMENDLWRYVPDPACGGCTTSPVAQFSAPNHICPGTCTDFVNNSIGATSYVWTFQGANPAVSTDENPTGICYNVPGTYAVSLVATNSLTSDTLTLNNYITVYPFPPPQGILQSGDTLIANAGAVSYQWFTNGQPITGATNYFYVAPASGNYYVVATDANGCEVEAGIFNVIASVNDIAGEESNWVVPNPFTHEITVKMTGLLMLYDDIGQKVFEKEITDTNRPVDLSAFAKGIYFLELESKGKTYQQKLVKTVK